MPYLPLMTMELAAHIFDGKMWLYRVSGLFYSYDRIVTTAVLIGHLIGSLDTEETIKMIRGIFISIKQVVSDEKLLTHVFLVVKLKSSLRTSCNRHYVLVNCQRISTSETTTDSYVPFVVILSFSRSWLTCTTVF